MIKSIRQTLQRVFGLFNGLTLAVVAAFTAKVAGTGLSFVFSIMLARLLGPNGTGIYFLVLTIVGIGATISRLGLDNAVLRFVAVARDECDRSALAGLYRQGMGLVVVAGIAVVSVCWLIMPYLQLGGDRSGEFQSVLPVMLVALIPTALILLQGEFFKAIGAPVTATFVQTGVLPFLLVWGAAFLFWRGGVTVHSFAFLYVVAAIVSILLAGALWSRYRPGLWQEPGHFDTRLLLRTSLPLLWVASMNLIMGWTDILVLGVWTDAAVVGVYGIATRIAALTVFILLAANSVIAPRFATLYAQGNHEALERLAQQSAGWVLLAALPIVLILMLLPELILTLFGVDFVKGASLLRILTLGQLVNVAMGSVGFLLMMTGHERLMRYIVMSSALMNLIGNLVLVPVFGGIGAAVSTAFSLVFMNLLTFSLVYRKLGINTLGYVFRGGYLCGRR